MTAKPAGFGPFLSTIGATLLGISVFLPWYALTLTAAGAASAQQAFGSAVQQFGNSTLQAEASTLADGFSSIAGHRLATASAHQSLKEISALLLILAAIAFLCSLLRLAGASAPIQVGGGQIALLGGVASLCVVFRMVVSPLPQQQLVSLSLGWGIWLALASSLAILIGGLWPARAGQATHSPQALVSAEAVGPKPDLDEYWRY
jgi:hypothetical protein